MSCENVAPHVTGEKQTLTVTMRKYQELQMWLYKNKNRMDFNVLTEINEQCLQIKRYAMQTGCIVGFFIFPIFLEGCCVENHQKKNTGILFQHKFNIAVEKLLFNVCVCF